MAVPSAPTFRTANMGSGVVRLSIDPVAGTTSYKVYRDEASPAATLLASGVAAVYFDNTAFGVGLYFYRVKATNADGDSAFSAEVYQLASDPVSKHSTNAKRLAKRL